MQHLLCDDLWQYLEQPVRKAKRRMPAVASYSDAEVLKFGKGDVPIVDASDDRWRGACQFAPTGTLVAGCDCPRATHSFPTFNGQPATNQ
jgi:hypothetical protein